MKFRCHQDRASTSESLQDPPYPELNPEQLIIETKSQERCSVCDGQNGTLIQCTGPCKRHFHCPDEQNRSCNPFGLSQASCVELRNSQIEFVCPWCWEQTRNECRLCQIKSGTLQKCHVGTCTYRYCAQCINDLTTVVLFDDLFICPRHFCQKCKSLKTSLDKSKLIHCPLCSKSYHADCMDFPHNPADCMHGVLPEGSMICKEHQNSAKQYCSDLLQRWKTDYLHLVPTPAEAPLSAISRKRPCREFNSALDEQSEVTSKEALQQAIEDKFKESKESLSDDEMTVFPPYDTMPTIPADSEIFAFAEHVQWAESDARHCHHPEFRSWLRTVRGYRENLRVYLNPLLHKNCYTSYGRHFTNVKTLRTIAQLAEAVMADGDMLVDMTCGRNEFIPLVKQQVKHIKITGRAYDIITPMNLEDWIRKSWFDVEASELVDGDHLVVGLNPPFGKNGALAETFLTKALEFQPRVVILISPDFVRCPDGYVLIYENPVLCKEDAFFTPTGGRSWHSEPPILRIYRRVDPPCQTQLHYASPEMHFTLFRYHPEDFTKVPNASVGDSHQTEETNISTPPLDRKGPHQMDIDML